jgi:hypothetical protein
MMMTAFLKFTVRPWASVSRPLERLRTLSHELEEEQGRLHKLYSEFPEGSEQRRFVKQQIRDLSAQSGSVTTSMMFHRDDDSAERANSEEVPGEEDH